jgi:hypothetical protein
LRAGATVRSTSTTTDAHAETDGLTVAAGPTPA